MARLIDADALIELIDDDIASLDNSRMPQIAYNECLCTLQMVKQYIKALPTVDAEPIVIDGEEYLTGGDYNAYLKGYKDGRAEPVKHGKWIVNNETKEWVTIYCDQCHDGMWNRKDDPFPNYCFNCGARMDGEENNGSDRR